MTWELLQVMPRLSPTIFLGPQVQPCTLPCQTVRKEWSPLIYRSIQFSLGALHQVGQYPLRQVPAGLGDQGHPRRFIYVYSLFSNLYNWKNNTSSYQDDPEKIKNRGESHDFPDSLS